VILRPNIWVDLQHELPIIRFIVKVYELHGIKNIVKIRMNLLDMASRDSNLDLTIALVAKVFEVFHHLELGEVYMKM
jgi:hypothetical protein